MHFLHFICEKIWKNQNVHRIFAPDLRETPDQTSAKPQQGPNKGLTRGQPGFSTHPKRLKNTLVFGRSNGESGAEFAHEEEYTGVKK